MTAGEKLYHLRIVEGYLRGLDREMTQKELVATIRFELHRSISQSYLSQLESGRRKHLTNTSRLLLAQFFRIHPGYLVDDPEGFQFELLTDLRPPEESLETWLKDGGKQWRNDPGLSAALHRIGEESDARRSLLLLAAILERPGLSGRLWSFLQPETPEDAGEEEQQ